MKLWIIPFALTLCRTVPLRTIDTFLENAALKSAWR